MPYNLSLDEKINTVRVVENYHVARVLLDLAGRDDLLAGILILLGEIGERREEKREIGIYREGERGREQEREKESKREKDRKRKKEGEEREREREIVIEKEREIDRERKR